METGDRPRLLALLVAQTVQTTGLQSINIIEVVSQLGTWEFPNGLPPYAAVAIVAGGTPGTIFKTKWRLLYQGNVLGEASGPDIRFTSQIVRANVSVPLTQITTEKVVKEPGRYSLQFLLNDEILGETPLPIIVLDKPQQRAAQ